MGISFSIDHGESTLFRLDSWLDRVLLYTILGPFCNMLRSDALVLLGGPQWELEHPDPIDIWPRGNLSMDRVAGGPSLALSGFPDAMS